jgi:hypothetical protein
MDGFFRFIWALAWIGLIIWMLHKDATSFLLGVGAIAAFSLIGLIGELLGYGYYETQVEKKRVNQERARLGLPPD